MKILRNIKYYRYILIIYILYIYIYNNNNNILYIYIHFIYRKRGRWRKPQPLLYYSIKCALRWDLQLFFEIFLEIPIIYENKWKKPWFYRFFMVFIIKFKFAPIFTMIFIISASKYVSIRSSKKCGGQTFSELHPF